MHMATIKQKLCNSLLFPCNLHKKSLFSNRNSKRSKKFGQKIEPYNSFPCSISITSIIILRLALKFVLITQKHAGIENCQKSKSSVFCMKLQYFTNAKIRLGRKSFSFSRKFLKNFPKILEEKKPVKKNLKIHHAIRQSGTQHLREL